MATEGTEARPRDDEDEGMHRLRDMVVEEVSLVDRAANKRRFLIVKRSDDMADDDKDGTELKPDGRGGLTASGVEKAKKKPGASAAGDEPADEEKRKKPAGEGDEAEKARRRGASEDDDETEKARKPKGDDEDETEKAKHPEDDDEDGEDDDKKKARKAEHLTIPKPVKEAVLRALTEALERLMSVANQVKEAHETEEQMDAPVPDEVGAEVRAIAEVLRGVGERYPSPTAKGGVAKGGARMAKDRLDRFQKAMAVLAEILKELTDSREAAPTAGVAEAGVRKRDGSPAPAPGLAELVAGIGELTRVVKRQEEELGRIRQARGVSNAIPVDGARRPAPEDVSWPFDMNRPITRDKVKKEVSFFDE
jgi:hypothetical protein